MKDFDISKLFGSKCRSRLLEKFFLEFESGNNEGFHMRAIARELDEQINSIKRELDNLTEVGLLKFKEEAKKKIFFLNTNFLLFKEFKEIFIKSYNPLDKVKKFFSFQKTLELIIINESLKYKMFDNGKTILDIFMIGEIDKANFNDFLGTTFFNKKIKYAIITKDDFYNRINYGDKLINNILTQSGNIYLVDKMKIKDALEK
ncbi:MAG: hypothetical protein PHN31_04655 [Candidatus Gracilibacteria bacterium]|nr:hypothetical protein [Candidatus Gracilibacteria bacterium]